MLKKQHEKDEGMDKLSRKQKSKIRSKAMVSSFKKKALHRHFCMCCYTAEGLMYSD